jgi:hypothetical protein
VLLTLSREDGRLLGQRALGATSCAELAEVAAVLLATWAQDLPAAQVDLATRRPVSQRWVDPMIAAGGGIGISGGQVRPALLADLALFAPGRAWGLRLDVLGAASRTIEVGAGLARYRRWGAAAGPVARAGRGPLAGQVWAGVGATWLSLRGETFAQNERRNDVQLAVTTGLRGLYSVGRWAFWVGATGAVWPARSVAVEAPTEEEAVLPRWELTLLGGLAFGS